MWLKTVLHLKTLLRSLQIVRYFMPQLCSHICDCPSAANGPPVNDLERGGPTLSRILGGPPNPAAALAEL